MGIVRVRGIKVHAYHGCLAEESVIGGKYSVSVDVHGNFSEAASTDNLSEAIDYVVVNNIVIEEMKINSKLIETAARRIIERLRAEFPQATKVTIELCKLHPPMEGNMEYVSVLMDSSEL